MRRERKKDKGSANKIQNQRRDAAEEKRRGKEAI